MTEHSSDEQVGVTGRATLKTVARAAGVHVSTVSRALRRAATPGTQPAPDDDRIVALARELGYVPNPNAASLTTKRSSAFGVLVPHLTDIVLSAIYDSIEHTANKMGYETFVANTHDDMAEQRRRIDLLLARHVDGLIIGDARLDSDNLTELARRGVKFVLVSRRFPGMLSSTCDDAAGGRLAGAHLADLGHRRVAIVSGPPWSSTGVDRMQGARDALAEAGVAVPDEFVHMSGFDVEHGRAAAASVLSLPDPPTAIFAANDFSAVGVLGELRRRGLRPGHDVAVVGYNDIPICEELMVPLTSVHSPLAEIGARAVEILLAATRGLPASSVAMKPELIVRETTFPGRLPV